MACRPNPLHGCNPQAKNGFYTFKWLGWKKTLKNSNVLWYTEIILKIQILVSLNEVLLDLSHTFSMAAFTWWWRHWVVVTETSWLKYLLSGPWQKKSSSPRVNQKARFLNHIVLASWLPRCVLGEMLWACIEERYKRKPSFLLQRCYWGHVLLFIEFHLMRTWGSSLSYLSSNINDNYDYDNLILLEILLYSRQCSK